jgi:hypothetical protein
MLAPHRNKQIGSSSQFDEPIGAFVTIGTQRTYCQVGAGSISSKLVDTSGAMIPGAVLTLTSETMTLSSDATTRQDGAYFFTDVKVGTCTVSAALKGFKKIVWKHVRDDIQQHPRQVVACR